MQDDNAIPYFDCIVLFFLLLHRYCSTMATQALDLTVMSTSGPLSGPPPKKTNKVVHC